MALGSAAGKRITYAKLKYSYMAYYNEVLPYSQIPFVNLHVANKCLSYVYIAVRCHDFCKFSQGAKNALDNPHNGHYNGLTMNEISEFISAKIAKAERDHTNALAKADEYTVKASEQRQRAEELVVLIRHLKQWGTEFGANSASLASSLLLTSSELSPKPFSPTVPVRALVKTALETLRDFSSGDLVSAVQAINPSAKKASILSELSHCKSRKDVIHFGQDRYRSCLYPLETDGHDPFSNSPFEEDASSQITDAVKGNINEPGPGFGKLS